ncbi:MAG: ABC transporter permease [Anaerolineaceae bacterium]|nr:ABC transporter permease [Anaerolineaceae bacterium]
MIQLLKMAFRDLGRNRRRSFFSALALAIGLALLLLMASVLTGEMRGSMDDSIKLESGHLQVQSKTYDQNKTSLAFEDLVAGPAQIAAQVAALAPVQVATPRLYASGIVQTGDNSVGVRIIGIDPPSTANAPYRDGIVSGQFLTADDNSGILIGKPLADKLGLNAGDQITLLVNTSNGTVDQQPFTIRGIYSTKTPTYDEGTVFMPLAKAQAITQAIDHASVIFVLLKDRDQAGAVAAAIKSSQYQVKTWQQMNSLLVQIEQLSGVYMDFLYLIILAITATVIINTLIMSVFERTREIGILAAIGMKSSSIMGLFFAESGLLGLGGIAMGMAVGGILVYLVTKYGFYIGNIGATGITLGDRIYGYLNPSDAISLVVVAFIVTLLAALYPAILAARMEPVDALRGGKK